MPRADRYFLPGYVRQITHRCHKKEFLLKFVRDRERWRHWLYQAKKRYGLSVLNFMITSNHIHLLVCDRGRGEIVKSIQLIAGRTAQEYNQRKIVVARFGKTVIIQPLWIQKMIWRVAWFTSIQLWCDPVLYRILTTGAGVLII